jgi:hypothetical protein
VRKLKNENFRANFSEGGGFDLHFKQGRKAECNDGLFFDADFF